MERVTNTGLKLTDHFVDKNPPLKKSFKWTRDNYHAFNTTQGSPNKSVGKCLKNFETDTNTTPSPKRYAPKDAIYHFAQHQRNLL